MKVQDTGAGISPESLHRVFDRFYSADPSRNRQVGGSGLGLAIAHAIVRAHGGEIEAFSAGVGKGSLFTIKL
jgi:histidine kinase